MRRYLFLSILTILSFMFLSCATPVQRIPLSKDSASVIDGKSCEISNPKTPDFYAQTTAKAWLPPVIGIAASFSAGREIVAENGIEDPAVFVSQEISKLLQEHFNVRVLPKSDLISENNDTDTLCKTYSQGDFLLDVRTAGWSFGTGAGSNPALSAQYVVSFFMHLKIVDVKSKQVLTEEIFIYPNTKSTDTHKTFSYDELMDNQAVGIKKELRKGAEEAVMFFREKSFNL